MKSLSLFLAALFSIGCQPSSQRNVAQISDLESQPHIVGQAKERGGGNAVVCFADAKTAAQVKKDFKLRSNPEIESQLVSITFLDLAEAKAPRGYRGEVFDVVEAQNAETPDQYVSRIVKRFERNIPLFAQVIKNGQDRFKHFYMQEVQEPIAMISDTGSLRMSLDSKCLLMTMMEQQVQNNREVMVVDRWLLDHPKHSLTSKGVAYLHEYIYAEARAVLGQATSESTRQAVGLAILDVTKKDPEDLKRIGLNVFEIHKQLNALGFFANNKERLWKNKAEVATFVHDQMIFSNALTVKEAPTMAHRQVEEILRQIALETNLAVNHSELANQYRQKIQTLYQNLGFKLDDNTYLDPFKGTCRPTGTEDSGPTSSFHLDMASCVYALVALGERPLIKDGMGAMYPDKTASERARTSLLLDISFNLKSPAQAASLKSKEKFKNVFRDQLLEIDGVAVEAVDKMLAEIESDAKNSLYLPPVSYLAEEKEGKLIYRGASTYLIPFAKRVETLIHQSGYALLAHPLPTF